MDGNPLYQNIDIKYDKETCQNVSLTRPEQSRIFKCAHRIENNSVLTDLERVFRFVLMQAQRTLPQKDIKNVSDGYKWVKLSIKTESSPRRKANRLLVLIFGFLL